MNAPEAVKNAREAGYIKGLIDAARLIEQATPEELAARYKLMNSILDLAKRGERTWTPSRKSRSPLTNVRS